MEQAGQDLVVGQRARPPVVASAVSLGHGHGHGLIQRLVGMVQPSGAGVVEVGEGAFTQLPFGLVVHGQDAVGITALASARSFQADRQSRDHPNTLGKSRAPCSTLMI